LVVQAIQLLEAGIKFDNQQDQNEDSREDGNASKVDWKTWHAFILIVFLHPRKGFACQNRNFLL